jgi:hypothetical protein
VNTTAGSFKIPREYNCRKISKSAGNLKAASNPGSKFHSFGQQLRYFFGQRNYLFGQQILMGKAANFFSKGSRFYRDWQQFLLKWAANIFNEIIFYIG